MYFYININEFIVKNGSKKIFLVDDEQDILEFLDYYLSREGYEIKTFKDPLLALSHIKELKPSLIITDLLMPKMDGYELCKKVKSNPSTSCIPLFIMSCKNSDFDKYTAFKLGAEEYFSKPFKIKELVQCVNSFF